MYALFKDHERLLAAGKRCGLRWREGEDFRHLRLPPHTVPDWFNLPRTGVEPRGVLSPQDGEAHEIGLFARGGQIAAVWDPGHAGGRRLASVIGVDGEDLKTAYCLETSYWLSDSVGWLPQLRACADGGVEVTLSAQGSEMGDRIVVRIDRTGSPTIEVKECSGPRCTELTAKLAEAFGTAVDQELKPEYYQTQEQTIAQEETEP